METMIANNDYDVLEDVVSQAHDICNGLLLFEAVGMEEREVRLVLDSNNVTEPATQDKYLSLVKEYDRKTGRS